MPSTYWSSGKSYDNQTPNFQMYIKNIKQNLYQKLETNPESSQTCA